jgi:hypothetical protein
MTRWPTRLLHTAYFLEPMSIQIRWNASSRLCRQTRVPGLSHGVFGATLRMMRNPEAMSFTTADGAFL